MKLSKPTEERLRNAFGVLVDEAPVGAEFDDLSEVFVRRGQDQPIRRRVSPTTGVVVALGLMTLLFVAVWTLSSEPAAPMITVDHIEATYEVSVPTDCDAAHDNYSSAEVDIWGPGPEGLFRIELGYPDGSSEWFIVDNLVNIEARSIWSPVTGQSYIGEGLPNPSCPSGSGPSPNRFVDNILYQLGLIVSGDNLVTIDGTTYTDALARLEPDRQELVAGVETDVFTTVTQTGLRSTVWFDEESRRVQRLTREWAGQDGRFFSEAITVTSRTATDVSSDLFGIEDILLYSFSRGQ
jgi:hypothetical protein